MPEKLAREIAHNVGTWLLVTVLALTKAFGILSVFFLLAAAWDVRQFVLQDQALNLRVKSADESVKVKRATRQNRSHVRSQETGIRGKNHGRPRNPMGNFQGYLLPRTNVALHGRSSVISAFLEKDKVTTRNSWSDSLGSSSSFRVLTLSSFMFLFNYDAFDHSKKARTQDFARRACMLSLFPIFQESRALGASFSLSYQRKAIPMPYLRA